MTHTFDLQTYVSTLTVGGEFHMVGLPDEPLPEMMAQGFAGNAAKLTGSHLGNNRKPLLPLLFLCPPMLTIRAEEMNDMLRLAAEKGIRAWVEKIDISEKGLEQVVERVKENKVHYRFSLVGFDKAYRP